MSITSDVRIYADTAFERGRQVVTIAQTQLADVTCTAKGTILGLRSKAAGGIGDWKAQAEDAVNLAASVVSDRATDLYASVRHDKRVARLVGSAEAVTGTVLDTVVQPIVSVVEPVVALTRHNTAQLRAATRRRPAPSTVRARRPGAPKSVARTSAPKPATTRPAARKQPTATKPTA